METKIFYLNEHQESVYCRQPWQLLGVQFEKEVGDNQTKIRNWLSATCAILVLLIEMNEISENDISSNQISQIVSESQNKNYDIETVNELKRKLQKMLERI